MATSSFPELVKTRLPTSTLIVAGIEHVKQHTSGHTYRHSIRSAYWALLLGKRLPQYAALNLRTDLITFACIMHDFGLATTEELISKNKRFEVDGANAALELAKKDLESFDNNTLTDLWSIIALHSTPSIAQHHPVPEVGLAHLGIICDFFGPYLPPPFPSGLISINEYKEVIAAFPVKGFKDDFVGTLCGICRYKRETTFDNVAGDFAEIYGLDGEGGGREGYIQEKEEKNMTKMVLETLGKLEDLQE